MKSRLYLADCKKLCENETYFGGLPSFTDIPSIGKIKEGLKIKLSEAIHRKFSIKRKLTHLKFPLTKIDPIY